MASRSGIQIRKYARVLAVALALGAFAPSLVPGQTAHAARAIMNEAGDADVGDGAETAPSARKPKPNPNPNDMAKCTITTSDGTLHFYVPGELVVVETKEGKKYLACASDGKWIVARPELVQDLPPGRVLKPAR